MNNNLKLSLILATCIINGCSISKQFPDSESEKTRTLLADIISELNEAPDDPKIFDEVFDNDNIYCPVFSEILWIVPSVHLPPDVKFQNSNNNVSACIFNKRLYMAFRTGPFHFASKKTGMYIISTNDFKRWKKEFEIFNGRDIREPYLTVINDTLHFYFFSSGTKMTTFKPERINHYVLTENTWTRQPDVLEKTEVHWEIKKRYNKIYLTSYAGEHYKLKGESNLILNFKHTNDGYHFFPEDSGRIVYKGGVSECAFEFDREGNLWAVTRLEDGDTNGFGSQLAFAPKENLQKWTFFKPVDPNCYMSPKMFRFQDDIFLIARNQRGKKPFGKAKNDISMKRQRLKNWIGFSLTPKTTALYKINKITKKIEWIMDLPGNGDTAFPSVQRLNKNQFLVANYSSSVKFRRNRSWLSGQFGKTGIYIGILTFDICD